MLVNKPQFDANSLAAGTAIRMKGNNFGMTDFNSRIYGSFNALILHYDPLKLYVVFVHEGEMKTHSIQVADVVNNKVKLEVLYNE